MWPYPVLSKQEKYVCTCISTDSFKKKCWERKGSIKTKNIYRKHLKELVNPIMN